MKKEKFIKVCYKCGTPLISTFFWKYHEYICLNCLNVFEWSEARDVLIDEELEIKYKILFGIWKTLSKYMIPKSDYKKRSCKKCQIEEEFSHQKHLSEKEKKQDEIAQKILKRLGGVFNEYQYEKNQTNSEIQTK
jgi:hypothetical protein